MRGNRSKDSSLEDYSGRVIRFADYDSNIGDNDDVRGSITDDDEA